MLLFEDIDQVFHDESEFHQQLLKLIGVTKVPIILTMSNLSPDLKYSFLDPFKQLNIDYDLVNYKYQQMRPRDLLFAFQTILLFESLI